MNLFYKISIGKGIINQFRGLLIIGSAGRGMLYTKDLEELRSYAEANQFEKIIDKFKKLSNDADEYDRCIYWLVQSHPSVFDNELVTTELNRNRLR